MSIYAENRERSNVEEYVSQLLNYESVVEATKELIELVNQDEETNQPIKMIVSQINEDKNYDATWCVFAVLADGLTFKYAMYISENGTVIADGF